MPFLFTGLDLAGASFRDDPDGCVRGVSADWECSNWRISGDVGVMGVGSGGTCASDGERVGGISTTFGTDDLDGSCSCGPWSFRPGGRLPSDLSHSPIPRLSWSNESRVPRDLATRLESARVTGAGGSWGFWGAGGIMIVSSSCSAELPDLLLSRILGLESAASCLTPRAEAIWERSPRYTSTD